MIDYYVFKDESWTSDESYGGFESYVCISGQFDTVAISLKDAYMLSILHKQGVDPEDYESSEYEKLVKMYYDQVKEIAQKLDIKVVVEL